MQTSRLSAMLFLFLMFSIVGCTGPTHTAGTRGFAAKDLAILSIAQLPEETHIQIQSIQFDGQGDAYSIGDTSRDFYLAPGNHSASFNFIAHVPGPGAWFIPKNALTIPGPKEIPLGTVAAGKAYDLAPPSVDSFDKFLENGSVSLVREKLK